MIIGNERVLRTWKNTGTSATVTFEGRPEQPYIIVGPLTIGEKYIFEEMHFHWANTDDSGCEHTLEGKKYIVEYI